MQDRRQPSGDWVSFGLLPLLIWARWAMPLSPNAPRCVPGRIGSKAAQVIDLATYRRFNEQGRTRRSGSL
jgi:hypothetical protein